VNVASTNAARLFGLYPRKGTIQPGADADLVIYDPDYAGTITAAQQATNLDYSAFEGWPISGRPDHVTVRGEVAVRAGEFVGSPSRGQFLKRQPGYR
jgi:dihydropyrimidinase